MKIKLSELKSNPFKKEINGGKLNETNISKLIESINHGTLPKIFTVRKLGNNYELCFGHHRLEALKRVKGKNYEVIIDVVKRTDEQMIVDMARENLAQRSDDFREEMATVKFVRKYLNDQLRNGAIRRRPHERSDQDIGARQIALFLSKDGKMISHSKVANLLKIDARVSPKLIEQAETSKNQWDAKTNVSPSILNEVAQLKDFKDQELIVKKAQDEEIGHKKVREIVSSFQDAPPEVKEKVRKGEINLSEIKEEVENEEMNQRSKAIKNAKDNELRIKKTEEMLTDLKDQIDTEFYRINKLMFLVGKVRKTKLYLQKPKEKENFFKYLDGIISRVEKWSINLRNLKENLELEVIAE